MEVVVQNRKEGAEVIRQAGGPYVFQGEGGAASASLTKGEIAMPGVSDGEG